MSLPVALGLYSVRDLYQTDFAACLSRTADIGYTGVECFGAPTLPAETVRAALDDARLELVGWHMPLASLEGDALPDTIRYLQTVGCTRAIVPYAPPEHFEERMRTIALAGRLNDIRTRLTPHGITLGYHNHTAEFVPLPGGELPWAVLMDHTNIIGQLDSGNALASRTPGLDVAELLARWPGRAQTLHVKPYSHTSGYRTMIGEDDIDWSALLYTAEHTAGTQWLIVEYEDEHSYGQFEGAAMCIHALEAYN